MALNPNAFSPDAGNDSQASSDSVARKRRINAILGQKSGLGALYSGDDTSDLSKSPLNAGETGSPLATPSSNVGEAGSPSLLATERVQRAPVVNFQASPIFTPQEQAGYALGEAERGEVGSVGGTGGTPRMDTSARNSALMSFFHPEQQAAPTGTAQPSDTAKAVGAAGKAVGAGVKAKSLFGNSPADIGTGVGTAADMSTGLFPNELTPEQQAGLKWFGGFGTLPKGSVEMGSGTGGLTPADTKLAADAEFGDAGGGFGWPDFSQAGTYGQGLGMLGSLAGLIGNAAGSADVAKAGRAAGAAGSGVQAGTSAAAGNVGGAASGGLGALGAILSMIAAETKNQELADAGAATTGAGITAGAAFGGPWGALAAPAAIGSLMAPYFRKWDQGRYQQARNAAQRQGDVETQGLAGLFSQIPENDLGDTYSALRAKLDPRGAVRSYFNGPDGVQEWSQMSPEQFQTAMNWIKEDPSRLSAVGGSGDVGYLNQYDAEQTANRSADIARALIARQLGLPYTSPETPADQAMKSVMEGLRLRDLFGDTGAYSGGSGPGTGIG